MATYRVRIEKEELVFSAAHFITFAGTVCEAIHGHNYRVRVEWTGPLDDNGYVVDFIALRDALRRRVAAWDHHVLLPTRHTMIAVAEAGDEVVVRYTDPDGVRPAKRWIFPRTDCVLLDIEQTTAELLAAALAAGLAEELATIGTPPPERLVVAVDENAGQWGVFDTGAA